jgi:cold shock CspA family protein
VGENNTVQEKGIDVWLALEAYELSIYKHFDILVLVAGDGDYVPLVRKLHTLGTQVVLLCWDFAYHNEDGYLVETKTSRHLMEEVFHLIPMHQHIDQSGGEYIGDLFVPDRTAEKDVNFSGFLQETGYRPKGPEEYESEILIINVNGFGFIRDEESNNVFFHYSSITNRDFSELQAGMRVRYTREEDAQRWKREGAPRYKAVKVTVTG